MIDTKKILYGILIVVALGAGLYYFFQNPTVISTDILTAGETAVVGEDILVLVEKLKTVSIDASLFSEPLFTSLKDNSVALTPEVQGRQNPFAQIGSEGSAPASTNKSTSKSSGQ